MPKWLPEEKRAKIKQLVVSQISQTGYVHVNSICRQEHISNGPIYRILDELGIQHRIMPRSKAEDLIDDGIQDNFKCLGVTSNCGNCKRAFQYPCPLVKE
jgi:hypothetical protein